MAKKCTCNAGLAVVALVLLTLGLYFLVWGFTVQRSFAEMSWSVWCWNALFLYAVGLVALGLGKMAKLKAGNCAVHKM
jgi:hypothetical protein